MMTLLVRRSLPNGGKASKFYQFTGEIEHLDGERGVHLVVHGVTAEDAGKPLEIDLAENDVAHVVSGDGTTVTTFRWRAPFAAPRSGHRRTA